MQTIHIFYSETEALLARQFLLARDIEAHIVGAKSYDAIVAGGGAGRYELKVGDENVQEAKELLAKKLRNGPQLADVDDLTPPPIAKTFVPNYFRKAVVYALCATFLLPLVFNVASLINARLYWYAALARKESDRAAKLLLLLALQVPGIVMVWPIYTYLRDLISHP